MRTLQTDITTIHFTPALHALGKAMGAVIKANTILVPSAYGDGFIKVMSFQNELCVMLADIRLKHEIRLNSVCGGEEFFTLSFKEMFSDGAASSDVYHDSMVTLRHSGKGWQSTLKAGCRLRTVKLSFRKQLLKDLLGETEAESFLSSYFSRSMLTDTVEPIDKDYRQWINDLSTTSSVVPLSQHYCWNRVMMLLEKFIIKNNKQVNDTHKLTADEIGRLMKVEAMLVKDFSVAPPTIDVLSRHCAMSPTKLKKDFKQLYGLPVYEYFQKNRMAYARTMLQSRDHSVKEVGVMVGYSNLSHFSASFRKEFGILPSQVHAQNEVLEATPM